MTKDEGIESTAQCQVLLEILAEVTNGREKHGPLLSPHDGYARLLGEVQELWADVARSAGTGPLARGEAIQVAALALRYVLEVCRTPEHGARGPEMPEISTQRGEVACEHGEGSEVSSEWHSERNREGVHGGSVVSHGLDATGFVSHETANIRHNRGGVRQNEALSWLEQQENEDLAREWEIRPPTPVELHELFDGHELARRMG